MLVANAHSGHVARRHESRSLRGIRPGRVLASVVLICLLALVLTGRYHAIDRMGYNKARLESRLLELERDRQALSLKIAQMESLARVEGVATGELGMSRPVRIASLTPSVADSAADPEDNRFEVLSFSPAGNSGEALDWPNAGQWFERLFRQVARAGSRP